MGVLGPEVFRGVCRRNSPNVRKKETEEKTSLKSKIVAKEEGLRSGRNPLSLQ